MTLDLILKVILWLYAAVCLVLIMVDFLLIDCREKLLLLSWCRYWILPVLVYYHFFAITFVGFFCYFRIREPCIKFFLMSHWCFCVSSIVDIFWHFDCPITLRSTHFVSASRIQLRKSCITITRLDHRIPFKEHFLTSSRFLVKFFYFKLQSFWEIILLFVLSKLKLLKPLFIWKFICWGFLNHFLIDLV